MRLSGDEFVVVMEKLVDTSMVNMIADKILHALDKQLIPVQISVSLGINIYPDDGSTLAPRLN